MQAHHHDDDAGGNRELARIGAQHGADRARAGAKRHEHGGEAEHEQEGGEERLAPHARLDLGVGEAFERGPGEIDEVRRHQRQHAG